MNARDLIFDAHAEDLLAAATALFLVLDEAQTSGWADDGLKAACIAGERFNIAMEGFALAIIAEARNAGSN